MEYTFTLKYRLTEQNPDPDDLIERLGEAGCNDALVGIGQPGRLALEFTRDGASALDAVHSALADVKHAIPSARLIEAAPDFVGLTDIAQILGVSRQNLRKLMRVYAGSFPPPVHEGSSSIWHLAEVLDWLSARGGYDLEHGVLETAKVAREVNLARQVRQLPARVVGDLERLIA